MDTFEIAVNVAGMTLRFAPEGDGRLTMMMMHGRTPWHSSVILRPEWLRPLAAWFAGEAEPGIVGHDEYGMPYGRWLAVAGDEAAVAYSTHTQAELTCTHPYGTARVAIGKRNRPVRFAVTLSSGARTATATYLRRVSAVSWTTQPL